MTQNDAIKRDQESRVTSIYHHLRKNKHVNKVILMDGPGRIVSKLKLELNRLNREVDIHVVDIDPIAVEWHNLFFPKEITGEIKDILKVIHDQDTTENKTFIYLNFCGISGTLNTLPKTGISDFIAKLNQINDVMISFSVRSCVSAKSRKSAIVCAKKVESCFEIFRHTIKESWNHVCNRGTFVTYEPRPYVEKKKKE